MSEQPEKINYTPISEELMEELIKSARPVEMKGRPIAKEGTIITPYEATPVEVKNQQLKHELCKVPLRWFTLAPVYAALKVPFSITEEFIKSELGSNATVITYEVSFPVLEGVPGWENKVEGIDPAYWDMLLYFLAELGFEKAGAVWVLNAFDLKLNDPGHENSQFDFTVFTPSSDSMGVAAFSSGGPVKLYKTAGHQRAVALADIYGLKKGGGK